MPQTGGHVGYIYLAGAVLIILGGSVLFISKRKKAKVNNK
jgi:LPXTG-motif cell wall-anchored protein